MRYSSWLEVFKNDPNNTTYNDKASDIIDLTLPATSPDECLKNITTEPNLISISVTPITNETQVFHHMQRIGGTIASPTTAIVAIRGEASNSQAVQFENNIFDWTKSVKLPSWSNISKVSTSSEVMSLNAPSRASSIDFRKVLLVPPLLNRIFLERQSSSPADLLIECLSAIKAFDSSIEAGATTPKADTSCRKLIFFLWASAQSKIDPTITTIPSSCLVKQFEKEVHEKFILPTTVPTTSTTSVTGAPSSATLSTLAGSITHLTSHLEKESDDRKIAKEDKRNKFDKLPESSKQIFLFAAAISDSPPSTEPNEELKNLLSLSTLSRARTHFNQVMKTYKCNFDVPTILVSSILAGDLIWIDSSQIPAKFSIFLMGRPNPKRAALFHKD